MTTYPDSDLQMDSCLILHIREKSDTQLFIGYDNVLKNFYLRGRRDDFIFHKKCQLTVTEISSDDKEHEIVTDGMLRKEMVTKNVPFAFTFEKARHVWNFINFVICQRPVFGKNNVVVSFYNYNNLVGMRPEEITFEFLEENLNDDYEICGYNNVEISLASSKDIIDWIKLLAQSCNF
jgi:hypothetical protein